MLMPALCPDRRHLQKAEQVLNPVPLIGFLTGMYALFTPLMYLCSVKAHCNKLFVA
jgi:hypothetical protein